MAHMTFESWLMAHVTEANLRMLTMDERILMETAWNYAWNTSAMKERERLRIIAADYFADDPELSGRGHSEHLLDLMKEGE